MRHDVFEKQIVNAVAGRGEVLPLQHGAQVLDDRQRADIPQHVLHECRCIAIPREDHRHLVLPAEPGLRLGGSDQFRKLHDMRLRPAVGPARKQNHVGPQLANPLNLLERLSLVVRGERLHHDRAGPKSRPLGTGGGHLPHDSRDQHLQAASRAGRGDVESQPSLPRAGRINWPWSSTSRRPDNSPTSVAALVTPTVTSAAGSSTVVGVSPRYVCRYTPSTFSIRMAFVVVLPQSAARMTCNESGLAAARSELVPPYVEKGDGPGDSP